MSQTDMIKMIEAFYNTALTDDQIAKVPTYEHEITPASLRHYLEQHVDSLPRLIDFLRVMPTVMRATTTASLTASPPAATQQPRKNSSVFDYSFELLLNEFFVKNTQSTIS
jgi:hypothetical protein